MKILIVDNNDIVQKLCVIVFEKLGHETVTVASGFEALRVLGEQKFDFIFLELFLSDMSGLNVLEKIKDQGVVAVIMTSYHSVELIRRAIELGASSYIFKPVDPDHLEATLVMCQKRHELDIIREEVKNKLLESQQKYKTLVDQVIEGIVIIQDGIVRFLNTSMTDILGTKMSRVINKDIKEVFASKEVDRFFRRMLLFIEEGVPMEGNFGFRNKLTRELTLYVTARKSHYKNRPADMFVFQDITERIEMNKRISKIEERYRILLENSTDAFFVIDQDAMIQDVNRRAETILISPRATLLNSNIKDMVADQDLEKFGILLNELRNLGGVPPSEIHLRRSDASLVPMEMSAVIIDFDTSLIIACDRTSYKFDEIRVKEFENSQNALMENIPGFVYRASPVDGTFHFVGSHVQDLSKYTPQDFQEGRIRWIDLMNDEDRLKVIEEGLNRKSGDRIVLEYRIKDQNETIHWVEDHRYYFEEDNKGSLMICGIIFDITENKLQNDRLRDTERRLCTLIQNTPAIVYGMRFDGNFTLDFLSPYIKNILGYNDDECLHMPENILMKNIIPEDLATVHTILKKYINNHGGYFILEYRMWDKMGEIHQIVNRGYVYVNQFGRVEIEGTLTEALRSRRLGELPLMENAVTYDQGEVVSSEPLTKLPHL